MAEKKQSWYVDDWMKITFSDESRIYTGKGEDADVVQRKHIDDYLKKISILPKSFMIWSYMPFKKSEMATLPQQSMHMCI